MNSPDQRTQSDDRPDDASLAELLQRLTDQASRLARQEVELAKAEMTAKGKRIGVGAGAFSAAGLLAVFGLGVLTTTAILLLATAMATWVAALIVAVVYLAVAGILALLGKKKVESASPPLPEKAVASVKKDVEETKLRAKEGRA
jgi:hypothetical protein